MFSILPLCNVYTPVVGITKPVIINGKQLYPWLFFPIVKRKNYNNGQGSALSAKNPFTVLNDSERILAESNGVAEYKFQFFLLRKTYILQHILKHISSS